MWNPGVLRQRRMSALDRVVARAELGDVVEPWLEVPGIWQTYRNPAEVLVELHKRWRTALAGAVYVAIEAGRGDLAEDVSRANASVAEQHRGLRSILVAHADHPAIATQLGKEDRLLRAATLAAA